MANQLQHSSSAYLKSAAHQPIDWHEFGEEAFRLARELDKPVLLDIGAVWCHWCHVIDRESYENDEIAALINEYYIPVKVDRDQRPDVDARYQQVVQSMSGQGGWPLTAFLTHDGRLIYGGTYFPPEAMKNLLKRIHEIYQERKQEIFGSGETLSDEHIRRMEAADREELNHAGAVEEISPDGLRQLCTDFLELVISAAKRMYEPQFGGFGSQPKFPHFSTLELMIAQIYRDRVNQHELLEMLEKTLTEMARGGMYDQIAGGFHRYSVDDHWHVPHFEKMAYDNAEAIRVYAQAYRLTNIPFFREVTEGMIGWVDALLSDQVHGGFYASQDADIDLHDDGDHFTWSPQELAEILTPQEYSIVSRYYDMHEAGDMHHAKGRNVLYVSRPPHQVGQELGIPVGEVEKALVSAKAKMLEKRRNRPMPFIDQSLYVNWNGMMIAAYFEAADLLDLPLVRSFAEKSLKRILSDFYRKNQTVLHTYGIDGFLEDYAWLVFAALKGYESTEEPYYLEVARDIGELILTRFEDIRLGGFYDTAQTDQALGLLKFKRKPVEDSPSSSANAVALQVLGALYHLTGEDRYRISLEKGLNLLIYLNGNYGLFVSALGIAADRYLHPPLKLEVVGTGHTPGHPLTHAARHVFYPGKMIAYHPNETHAEVRICVGTRCLAPIADAGRLEQEVYMLAHTLAKTH
jgi:uncharacterized protein